MSGAVSVIPQVMVGVTGGSGSGKTALAHALADRLGRHRVSIISQDAYYRDQSHLPPAARATLNYDAPEAFDGPLFSAHLRALRSGTAVHAPVYTFDSHSRTAQTRLIPAREVVLVEGLLLLLDPQIRSLLDLRIFLDAPEGIRLARRIQRDTAERGRTAADVIEQFFTTVRPAHERYVEPTKGLADLVILNTGALEMAVRLALDSIQRHIPQGAADGRRAETGGPRT